MNIIGRDNNVKKGFFTYPEFIKDLLGRLTDDVLSGVIPDEKLKKIKRVIVTGNGDSYAAALATKEFNSRMFHNLDYQVQRCIDVSRHHVFNTENPEETLVMVISVSGGGARVAEAIKRAATKGCTTLAITATPESRMAKEAQYILKIEIPKAKEFSPTQQTKTYVMAICTTLMLGLHAGLLHGNTTKEEAAAVRKEITDYVKAMCSAEVLDRVDEQMYTLAQTWKDYLGFDFVGGGVDFATAYFGTAKFFELCGSLNCLNDSEDWCHIDYFQTKRDQLGSIVVASGNCASFSRSVETVGSMQKSNRNVLVVTDMPASEFIEGAAVCRLPATKHDFIDPIMNFIPLFMLGNYIALARGYEYFGGMGPSNPLFSQEGGINTIKSSEIVYVE